MSIYGYKQEQWDLAKEEVKKKLIEKARTKSVISSAELTQGITALHMDRHDQRMFPLLEEISTEENAAGRGLLSAVVVYRPGEMQPGPGFFDLAKKLGRDTSNIFDCWTKEINKVQSVWSPR